MFSLTPRFRFLDIINYVGPGTSYDVWTKAYGCSNEKSWLPYEWFDDPEKLNYPDLPDLPSLVFTLERLLRSQTIRMAHL